MILNMEFHEKWYYLMVSLDKNFDRFQHVASLYMKFVVVTISDSFKMTIQSSSTNKYLI